MYIADSARKITQEGLDSCGTTLVPAGSVVLSTRAPIGSLAIAKTILCTNQGCKSLVALGGRDSLYLAYVLLAAAVPLNLRGKGTTFLELSADELGAFEVPAPPLDEQCVIATFLDCETRKIDALIAEQERLISLLAEKRQATISHAVTRGLNPDAPMKDSGVPWLGEVPAHWGSGSLTRIAERVVVGIAEAATHAYQDDGVPILRSTNVRAGRLVGEVLRIAPDFAAARGSKLICAGDLVTVRTGNAGVTAVVPPELDQCQCFTMLITTLQKLHCPSYYCYWFNSEAAVRYFQLEGWGTAQVNISVPILKALPVLIPPPEEQLAIAKFLATETERVDALSAQAACAIDLLKERRSALISAAVTGQIDVCGTVAAEASHPNPNAEPVAVA
jgi:type I restriction enzyme S subunit